MFKLKRLPNILSISRIFFCIPLIFLKPFSLVSMVLYIIAGLTDLFDGPLARRIKDGKTELGAVLDSIADMLLVFVGIFVLLPKLTFSNPDFSWLVIAYIIGLTYKVLSGFVGYFKHKVTVLLHTYTNKALGMLLWLIPIFHYIVGPNLVVDIYIMFVLACIFIITTEEILINLLLLEPSRNIKSIFGVKAENELILQRRKNCS